MRKLAIILALVTVSACAIRESDPVSVEAQQIKAEQRARDEAVTVCKEIGDNSPTCLERIIKARLGRNTPGWQLRQGLGLTN